MKLGQVLREARIKRGLTLLQVAEGAGVPKGTLSSIELTVAKDPTFTVIARIAKFYGISLDRLYAKHTNTKVAKVAEAKLSKHYPVPLLERWSDIEPLLKNKEIDELFVSVIHSPMKCSDRCFSLKVESDSMSGGMDVSIPKGARVIVDPTKKWANYDIVVARCDGGAWVIRQIQIEGDIVYFKPLHPQYPVVQATNFEVAGVVLSVMSILK